jgi:hypothetical protein
MRIKLGNRVSVTYRGFPIMATVIKYKGTKVREGKRQRMWLVEFDTLFNAHEVFAEQDLTLV